VSLRLGSFHKMSFFLPTMTSLSMASVARANGAGCRITGGSVLQDGALVTTDVVTDGAVIASFDAEPDLGLEIDARGLLVLPGIVDIHGDGFERLITPRPGVSFQPEIALLEADRQFAANGITTAYHSVTWSWEGGLRGEVPALALLEALERLRPRLAVDTRYHLRHETFNLDAEPVILDWIDQRRIDCLAFNDHMAGTIKERHRPDKVRGMLARSGLDEASFDALIASVHARAADVPSSVMRIANHARAAGLPMLSHDDMSPCMRAWYRELGCSVAEFPINVETAQAAASSGDPIVFGAPNVVRGGSHTGCPSAAEMAARGLCTVLASDYYYPSLAIAPFLLASDNALPLPEAWALVSSGPADALGLTDRGRITKGFRADIVLVEDCSPQPPRIVATMAAGRLIHCTGVDRLRVTVGEPNVLSTASSG
jgi:alpha-D-ribose 1-methylphosphonate 5-triphosphate diphosphatase